MGATDVFAYTVPAKSLHLTPAENQLLLLFFFSCCWWDFGSDAWI